VLEDDPHLVVPCVMAGASRAIAAAVSGTRAIRIAYIIAFASPLGSVNDAIRLANPLVHEQTLIQVAQPTVHVAPRRELRRPKKSMPAVYAILDSFPRSATECAHDISAVG
jgi:hypothetical protein